MISEKVEFSDMSYEEIFTLLRQLDSKHTKRNIFKIYEIYHDSTLINKYGNDLFFWDHNPNENISYYQMRLPSQEKLNPYSPNFPPGISYWNDFNNFLLNLSTSNSYTVPEIRAIVWLLDKFNALIPEAIINVSKILHNYHALIKLKEALTFDEKQMVAGCLFEFAVPIVEDDNLTIYRYAPMEIYYMIPKGTVDLEQCITLLEKYSETLPKANDKYLFSFDKKYSPEIELWAKKRKIQYLMNINLLPTLNNWAEKENITLSTVKQIVPTENYLGGQLPESAASMSSEKYPHVYSKYSNQPEPLKFLGELHIDNDTLLLFLDTFENDSEGDAVYDNIYAVIHENSYPDNIIVQPLQSKNTLPLWSTQKLYLNLTKPKKITLRKVINGEKFKGQELVARILTSDLIDNPDINFGDGEDLLIYRDDQGNYDMSITEKENL